MVFNALKRKAIRKIVDKEVLLSVPQDYNYQLSQVGIVLEKGDEEGLAKMVSALNANGVKTDNITVLIFDSKNSKQEQGDNFFRLRDFDSSGNMNKTQVLDFVNKPFDLLISYYKEDSAAMLWVTSKSKALFKTGIASVSSSVNHFNIDLHHMDGGNFIKLLFEYINIFKN
ncbi:DUF6913 domain-containing protein [Myroides injenensis]|uniref:DUF6913 domain-containing protein n=1 Tax=Myroides injenensis TaxID=1183151 RepID=UPI00028A2F2F|nr:hypothetical protein [Myroides injenensis]